jgi:hypothetical protein
MNPQKIKQKQNPRHYLKFLKNNKETTRWDKNERGKNQNLKCGNQVRAETTTTSWPHRKNGQKKDTKKGIRIT